MPKKPLPSKFLGRQRMRTRPLARLGFLVGVCLLAGCATLAELVETPGVTIAELAIVEAGLTSQSFRVGLDIDNPNAFAIPLARIDYALDIGGQKFATGSSTENVTLAANGSQRVVLEFQTNLMSSAQQLAQLLLSGSREELDYRVYGGLGVDLPFTDRLGFESVGRIALTRD